MKLIQTLEVGKVKFHIVKDDHGYWGINDKYVENMKIAHGINGLEGNLANSYIETIRLCWLSAKRNTIQYLYDESNINAWLEAFNKLEDEFDQIGVTEVWSRTKHLHLS